MTSTISPSKSQSVQVTSFQNAEGGFKWILRSLRAGVPLLGEPSFRVGVSHRAVAG